MTLPDREVRALEALCARGQRLLAAGNAGRALRVFQAATMRHPLEAAAWIGVAFCQQELGDSASALLAYAMARALGADHPPLALRAAECRVRLGDGEGALQDLGEALEGALARGDERTATRARLGLEWLSRRSADGLGPAR